MHRLNRIALLAAFAGALACSGGANGGDGGGGGSGGSGGAGGSDAGPTPDGGLPVAGDYFPVKVGSWWLYKVLDITTLTTTYKRVTIEALEPVGGTGPNAAKPAIRAASD